MDRLSTHIQIVTITQNTCLTDKNFIPFKAEVEFNTKLLHESIYQQ